MALSKAQETAVFHNTGPMLVLAGPGSGKTTVITHRINHLVGSVGVTANHILVISFTKASAIEMKERFLRLSQTEYTLVNFGTFHSVFFNILKQSYKNKKFSIISETEKRQILTRLIHEKMNPDEVEEESLDLILQEISIRKNSLPNTKFSPTMFCEETVFQDVFTCYQKVLKKNNYLDFDDILQDCYTLLIDYPDILSFWQKYFTYILIDEFQDINPIQFEIIRLLALPENNLFVVGDDDQAIYGFRGASPEIMLNFKSYYPDAILHLLDTNYRCHPKIVEASLKLIAHNKERYDKDIKSGRTDMPENGENRPIVSESKTETQNEEFEFLIQSVICLHNSFTVNFSDIAFLFRKQSSLDGLLYLLKKHKIPFQCKNSNETLLNNFITKDLISYFKLAYKKGSRADFLLVMQKSKCDLYRSDLKTKWNEEDFKANFYILENMREQKLIEFSEKLEFLGNLPFEQGFTFIRKAFRYDKFLEEYAKKNNTEITEYQQTLQVLSNIAREAGDFNDWLEYLQGMESNDKDKEENGITLMTFHGSKGLEFKEVFLLDVNEEITPHKKALTDEEIQEERRMFYVAMTRAKEHLHLCYTEHYFNKKLTPSRFLSEYKEEADNS